MRALLVDDSGLMRHLLSTELRERGHDVVACGDAETAWDLYQQEPFPLVMADWILPGMDGLELCRRIRSRPDGDQSVILIVTAQDQPEHLAAVLDAGASDYLPKPFTPQFLQVRLAIAERQAAEIAVRRAAETALIEARAHAAEAAALRVLSRQQRLMIRVVAHELRTPLAMVYGFSELLLELEPLSERLQEQLGVIHQGASRLNELVNNIVDLSLLESGEAEIEQDLLDLAQLLTGCLAQLGQPPRLTIEVAPGVPSVRGDELRLCQAIQHLVKNALLLSPPETVVAVSLRLDGPGRVAIDVVDHGPGIPSDQLGLVFNPFFRTDVAHDRAVPGAGLGLALARRIAELHGGQIRATSVLDQQTTFTIQLPAAS